MFHRRFIHLLCLCLAVMLLFAALPVSAEEEEGESPFSQGPGQFVMGENLAEITLSEDHAYTGAETAQALLAANGNYPNGSEIGLVVGTREEDNWFMIFEWDAVGYVPDDEKDDLDADTILDSFVKGTEQTNERRKEQGEELLFVKGWHTPPYYDEATNNLRWVLIGESESGRVSYNYNTRILGRRGYMSVVLVTSPDTFETDRASAETVIDSARYTEGESYAEFREGDKLAKYGLTALIAGGAGAAGAKFGLFKFLGKAGKFVILAALASLGAVAKFAKGIFRKGGNSDGEVA